jgi:HSP20 family protein
MAGMYETADKVVYEIEVPGVDRRDLGVFLDGRLLMIQGERGFDRDERRGKWLWKESSHGAFMTSFTLPEWVDADSIRAAYWNGLLRIAIDKKSWARPKHIPIQGGRLHAVARAA